MLKNHLIRKANRASEHHSAITLEESDKHVLTSALVQAIETYRKHMQEMKQADKAWREAGCPETGHPLVHPRSYGLFARQFGRQLNEAKILLDLLERSEWVTLNDVYEGDEPVELEWSDE